MTNEIKALIKNWKETVDREIGLDTLYLFGSSIYQKGQMFTPSKSDLDLIAIIPSKQDNAIDRSNWIYALKKHKSVLEKDLLFLLKRESNTEEIVSLVPITELELAFNIHKGETRNFFEINQFMNIDTDIILKGSEIFAFKVCQNEFVIQVLKSIQKARNKYLKNSAMHDFKELEWSGSDILPKEFARESAKTASLTEESFEAGDELNTSFGNDYIKQNLKKLRSFSEYSELYTWIDTRSGGRSNSLEKNVLNQNKHLLLYEFLYDLTIRDMRNTESSKKKYQLK
ncbi:MAG: hypothetical protein U0X91_20585 [Spirosomataceae bacterium]